MRPADIVLIALSSLWQQKGRTLLTLIGVSVGSVILLLSMAVRSGVQEAVVSVFRKTDELRKIYIHRQYTPPDKEIPPEEVEPHGAMSPAKRERIRRILVRQWKWDHRRERAGITREQLDEIESMVQVAEVVPDVILGAWGVLGDQEVEVRMAGGTADADVLHERIVAGSVFPSNEDDGAVIHEFLAYRWGAASNEEAERLVGQTMWLEVRVDAEDLATRLAELSERDQNLSHEEIAALGRAVDRLPELIENLPLPEDERAAMRKAFFPSSIRGETPTTRVIVKEFVIRGVFRSPTEAELESQSRNDWLYDSIHVLLPVDTATNWYFSELDREGNGLRSATVIVDDEAHLRPISARLREQGYSAYSLIQLVDLIQENVSIITWALAAVACIALFVAAVGITNTMIMSVLERTHEIGVMKSVGARNRHILLIFLAEGVVVGMLGAVLSIAIGLLMSLGIDWMIRKILVQDLGRSFAEETLLAFSWQVFAAVVAVASLFTALAAVVPARRAARIDPVAALRHE